MIDLAQDSAEVRRSVAISTGTQGCARVLNIVLNVATTLIIIRYLSPSKYGNYVLVLTVSLLIGLVADFGLAKLATREVSREHQSEDEVLGTILHARLCLSVLCIAAKAPAGPFRPPRLAGLARSRLRRLTWLSRQCLNGVVGRATCGSNSTVRSHHPSVHGGS